MMLNKVSLNTIGLNRIGLNRIGKPSRASSDRPYIDPEVLASLKAVCICYGKSNDDPDRAVVKNLVDPDNPFVISNAAYTEGSGYADKDSPYYGAFVTDGIDDLITSTKTASEMGITNEVTVVSMIHQIRTNSSNINRNNFFCNKGLFWFSNNVINSGKTGIYGYTSINNSVNNIINNILGDKNDYSAVGDKNDITPSQFSVVGYIGGSTGEISYTSSVAWYWTIIANKVLTTDQINQVIAYFNLDRTLNPDILCNTIKQGITNENHAEFGDKLIDFSGNGRDIQLNNIAWKGDSGIGKYAADFTSWTTPNGVQKTSDTVKITTEYTENWVAYFGPNTFKFMKVLISGIPDGGALHFFRTTADGGDIKMVNGINEIPEFTNTRAAGFYIYVPLGFDWSNLVIEQIPSHAGALCLDGVNDFGKVTGMPIYKDYTIVVDYERISGIEQAWTEALISKSYIANQGAFVLMETNGTAKHSYSFGAYTTFNKDDSTRTLLYQSKYKCGDVGLNAGTGVDGDTLWLGTYRDNYSSFFNGAIYSLMSFPYSMSEFLIERQLKKHKLGTLYPDMVEFRPIVKSNLPYSSISYSVNPGEYISVDSMVTITVTLPNTSDKLMEVSCNAISDISISGDNGVYEITGKIVKSPQKINITIDEYIRYEDIVQPYPSLFTLIDYDTEEVYSWGSKLKVGARFKGNVVNLLPNMYEWQGDVLYNGEVLNWGINPGVVAKEMVFSWNMPFKYLIDNNEPKCILSPRLLRIPNSSYKILGYIPDISGHGNNGVIHNSAYAEGSGVNEDGSYQLDGVDDFVTIPTIAGKQVLIKLNWQNKAIGNLIYDQRGNGSTTSFAIMPISINDTTNNKIAYQTKNANGITYIDGIRNEYIESYSLENIIHNITITNPDVSNKTVALGASNRTTADYFAKYALYDFMLFDNISTDDKIKELNEYVGIEAKVELPPYYWDTYGKTNSDADRDTIQQRGVAIGDYDLTNYNHAYEGMSGYNGYPVVFGAGKTLEVVAGVYSYISDVTSTTIHVTMVKNAGTGLLFSYVKKDGALTNIKEIPAFRVTIKGLEGNSKFGYRYLATEDATEETLVYLGNGTHELAKSFAPTEALLDLTRNAWVGIFITPMVEGEVVFDCDITIEVLPEYENGLAYDGITDYSKNANIPVLTDYTYIYKRTIINIPTNAATLLKGADKTNGGAFIADYGNKWQFNFGQYNTIQGIADGINWQTVNSFNGTSINKGENTDDSGITVAKFSNGYTSMVFYKLILYPKTISLLEINFLKNLMERDEIIDLNNPIFIQE